MFIGEISIKHPKCFHNCVNQLAFSCSCGTIFKIKENFFVLAFCLWQEKNCDWYMILSPQLSAYQKGILLLKYQYRSAWPHSLLRSTSVSRIVFYTRDERLCCVQIVQGKTHFLISGYETANLPYCRCSINKFRSVFLVELVTSIEVCHTGW